jgi:hypothetical protein
MGRALGAAAGVLGSAVAAAGGRRVAASVGSADCLDTDEQTGSVSLSGGALAGLGDRRVGGSWTPAPDVMRWAGASSLSMLFFW